MAEHLDITDLRSPRTSVGGILSDRVLPWLAALIAILVLIMAIWLPIRVLQISSHNADDIAIIQKLAQTNKLTTQRISDLTVENRALLAVLCTDFSVSVSSSKLPIKCSSFAPLPTKPG